MEFLLAIALFLAKAVIIVIAFAAILILIIQAVSAGRSRKRGGIEVEKLNERYRTFRHQMQSRLLPKKEFKQLSKTEKENDQGRKTIASRESNFRSRFRRRHQSGRN